MMSFLKNVKKRNYVLCGDYCEKQTIFLVQINVYAFRPNNISLCVSFIYLKDYTKIKIFPTMYIAIFYSFHNLQI